MKRAEVTRETTADLVPSSAVGRTEPSARRWPFVWLALWLAAGLGCLMLDDWLQPHLTELGKHPVLRELAEHWQQLGATWGIVGFLVTGLAVTWRDRGRTLVRFAVCLSLAGLVVQTVKYLVGRARPNEVGDITHFYGPLGMFNPGPAVSIDAMPSGHTTVAFAMAVALSGRWPRLRGLWYSLAAGVGVARTLLDRHFPSDVILGALLGTLVGLVVYRWRGWRTPKNAGLHLGH